MLVILVSRVVDTIIIIKKWRAEEEERHKELLTPPKKKLFPNRGYPGARWRESGRQSYDRKRQYQRWKNLQRHE
jgi:hypothetical protein